MNIYKPDYDNIKENHKNIKELINKFDNFIDSNGKLIDCPHCFNEYLRTLNVAYADAIKNMLLIRFENY